MFPGHHNSPFPIRAPCRWHSMASASMLKLTKLDPTFMGSRATPWNIHYRKCMLEHHTSQQQANPSEQPWKGLCLESQAQCQWEPKGNCSRIQLPFRDHSHASIAQQCWISLGSHYTLPSLRITVAEGSFEVLCPDSASDISRGVFPTAAAAKEHNAWNGGLGGKRKHDSANFLLAEQLLHELMCCTVLLCHLPSAGSLRSQPGYLASGPTTDRSRKMRCFKLQYINTSLSWTFACLWCGPITPQVQYQFSKWLNKYHVQL